MKAPLKWLKDYVDITLSPDELARRLALAGLEAKEVVVIGAGWEQVVVGEVKAITPHPNADRLRLVTVDLGGEQPTVVCGAPNLTLGDKIAFAEVGARLRDGHTGETMELKPAKIRGVLSSGMVCSERELGISDSHEGILVLPAAAPVGMPLADYLGDAIFDLEVTPNRVDCLSVVGIAREIAALTGRGLCLPEISYREGLSPVADMISVEITAPDLCPRYAASVITGVKIGESPDWIKDRLVRCGMRPINNVVDITNYVMMEYGQPLHAFDYARIHGKQIIVRRARDSEEMATLDGTERKLSAEMLVIADAEGTVAVAGVMGGAASEVSDGTTAILLEAANFNPASVHHTGEALRLPSEARTRFERGLRPELAPVALRRATELIVELAGGEAAKGIIDVYPGKIERLPIRLSLERLNRFLGAHFTQDEVVAALTSLGFELEETSPGEFRARVPYWRSDIRLEVDLMEEVARILGYDRIPLTLLAQPIPAQNPDPLYLLGRRVKEYLAGVGFQEIVSFSLTSREALARLRPEASSEAALRVLNPITVEQEYLRPNLKANLIATLAANRKHEAGGICLFELGRVYHSRPGDLPAEPEMLCGLLAGARQEAWWHAGDGTFDFYDARGVVEALFRKLGVTLGVRESHDVSLHPARQAEIAAGDMRLGVIGELDPRVAAAFEITETVALFEIGLAAVLPALKPHMFRSIPRFPAVERDMALVVDASVAHSRLETAISGFPLVSRVVLFDVYSGKQVPLGKKSLAYRLIFQSPERTLTDEEVEGVAREIIARLGRDFGAVLRS